MAKEIEDKITAIVPHFVLDSMTGDVKEALIILGLSAGDCRIPIMPLSQSNRNKLREIPIEMDLLK